jgi:hypothetical protein
MHHAKCILVRREDVRAYGLIVKCVCVCAHVCVGHNQEAIKHSWMDLCHNQEAIKHTWIVRQRPLLHSIRYLEYLLHHSRIGNQLLSHFRHDLREAFVLP